MSQQIINIGSAPNDGTGDPLRTAYAKCNNNFTELYANIARPQSMGDGGSNITVGYPSGPIVFTVNDVANVFVVNEHSVNVAGNANIAGNSYVSGTSTVAGNSLVLGNVTAGGIITDHYYYANGAPVDFEQPAGSNTQIQYNYNGSFGASAAFTFDQATNALSIGGTLSVATNATINGNLIVNGNAIYANVETLNVQDPILGLGRGANNTPLTANDGKDRGEQLWYYTTGEKSAFTGYQNSSGKILLATDVTITNEIVTVNALGNVVLGNAEVTTITATGNIVGGNLNTSGVVSATGTVYGGALSTTGSITAAGNITGGNLNTTGIVSATTLVGTTLSVTGNITAGNINGNITGNIGTVSVPGSNSQILINDAGNLGAATNITYTGTGLSATGNVTAAYVIGNGSLLSNITGANVTGVVGNASYATQATNATAANVAYSVSGANVSGTVATAATVTTAAQPNITSVGTLSSLTVSGNVTASYFVGTATTAQYADLAEMYCSDYPYEPGTVVSFGGEQEITISDIDHDRTIAGVVSTDPAHLMNSNINCEHAIPVALQGRVPCKVIGPVIKGQMMVSAGNGYARAELQPSIGAVIGKALQNHPGGEGIIEVVVGRI